MPMLIPSSFARATNCDSLQRSRGGLLRSRRRVGSGGRAARLRRVGSARRRGLGTRGWRRGARRPAAASDRHDLGGEALDVVARAPDQHSDAHRKQQRADDGDQRAVDRQGWSSRRAAAAGRVSWGVCRPVQQWHTRRTATLPALDAVALVGRHSGATRRALLADRDGHRRTAPWARRICPCGITHALDRPRVDLSGGSARFHRFVRAAALWNRRVGRCSPATSISNQRQRVVNKLLHNSAIAWRNQSDRNT